MVSIKQLLVSFLFVGYFSSCQPNSKLVSEPKPGMWHANMSLLKGVVLPFNFRLEHVNEAWSITIINGEETITIDSLQIKNDSLIAPFPVFESTLKLNIIDSTKLEGEWVNYYKSSDYKLAITANYATNAPNKSLETSHSIGEKYAVTFSPNTKEEYPAIGLFKQNANKVTGTFATETGDYRHLEGSISGDSLVLSTFDGSHAFLFKAAISDSTLNGMFWSGSHFKEPWVAKINHNAELRNADSLTHLKPGYEKLSFSFPNAKGEMVSLSDQKFKNKVVIVQIMGSWCPNCLDETQYLSSLYKKYYSQGLEIIALAFERTDNQKKALENLRNLKNKTGANYTYLLGGATRKEKAEDKLPMLSHVMSYPTAIFIDRQGNIQRIHTGFYGPSTGKYFTDFTKETESLVNEMLNTSVSN